VDFESGLEQRGKKAEALDVIDVQVAQQDVDAPNVGRQLESERSQAGSRVEHEHAAIGDAHLDAGGVAAVPHGVVTGCRL
jgi:hypothetical protein